MQRFVDSSKCEPGQLLISIPSPLTVHYISIKFAADLEENGCKNMDHITIYVNLNYSSVLDTIVNFRLV